MTKNQPLFIIDRDWLNPGNKKRKSWTGTIRHRSLYGLSVKNGTNRSLKTPRRICELHIGTEDLPNATSGQRTDGASSQTTNEEIGQYNNATSGSLPQSYELSPDDLSLFRSYQKPLNHPMQHQLFLPEITWHSVIDTIGHSFSHKRALAILKTFNPASESLLGEMVPQLLASNSTIRHQVVATELAMRSYYNDLDNTTNHHIIRHHTFTLQKLSDLSNPPPTSTVLICCLLFLIMHAALRDSPSLLLHLKSGSRVLRQHKNSRSHIDHVLSIGIEPVFTQLEAIAISSGLTKPTTDRKVHPLPPILPTTFDTFDQIQAKFFELCQWTFLNDREPRIGISSVTMERWTYWHQGLKSFSKSSTQLPEQQQLQLRLLDLHFRTFNTCWQCQVPNPEMIWDTVIDEQRDQLQVCRDLIYNDEAYRHIWNQSNDDSTQSNLNLSVSPPLWIIAMFCRNPYVRRQANILHRLHHRRCGHLDECTSALPAEIIMQLEEAGLDQVNSHHDIDESRRVRLISTDVSDPKSAKIVYTKFPYKEPLILRVPYDRDDSDHAAPFTFWPLVEAMRCSGLLGLNRIRSNKCMCKMDGAAM